MVERRRHKRLGLDVSVDLGSLEEPEITAKQFVRVDAADISRTGIGFQSGIHLQIGSRYHAKIQLWTSEVIEAVFQIVRCAQNEDGSYQYGAAWIGMSDEDAMKIDIYEVFHDV